MASWAFCDMDFDDIAELPPWAYKQHLTLHENSNFILEAPQEDEDPSLSDEMYDADDEEESDTDREERQRREYSQARDNEPTNSLSDCSHYSPRPLERGTRISFAACPRRHPTVSSTTHPDLLAIFDDEAKAAFAGFEKMSIDFVPNALAGFETMHIHELTLDYECALMLHPSQPFPCDTKYPEIFSMEPHWFHDTSKIKCWCYHCAQYRDFQSTGKRPEAHDPNRWCLCISCMAAWHETLDEDVWCNCHLCIDVNEAEATADRNEALASLQYQLLSSAEAEPEQDARDVQKLVDESSQKPPSDPLGEDSSTVVTESEEPCLDLYDMILEILRSCSA